MMKNTPSFLQKIEEMEKQKNKNIYFGITFDHDLLKSKKWGLIIDLFDKNLEMNCTIKRSKNMPLFACFWPKPQGFMWRNFGEHQGLLCVCMCVVCKRKRQATKKQWPCVCVCVCACVFDGNLGVNVIENYLIYQSFYLLKKKETNLLRVASFKSPTIHSSLLGEQASFYTRIFLLLLCIVTMQCFKKTRK